jgi:hypothetical protein
MPFNRSQAIHCIIARKLERLGAGVAGVYNDCGDAPSGADVVQRMAQWYAQLEALSDDDLRRLLDDSGYWDVMKENLIAERIEASIEGQHRNQSVDAARKSAAKRGEQAAARDFKIMERVRQLPAARRKTAKQAYVEAELSEEEMPLSTFQRRLWSKIR